MNKTTTDDFLFFKQQCDFWLKTLNLTSWKVYYKHENCHKHYLADTSTGYTGQAATIRLNKNWEVEITQDALRESALHEILEVFMSPLFGQAQSRIWSVDDYEKEHHRIIRTITHLLLK